MYIRHSAKSLYRAKDDVPTGGFDDDNNYPKRFEILQNDGEILKLRINNLAKGKKKYHVKLRINKKQKEIRSVEDGVAFEYEIYESGIYTFSVYVKKREGKIPKGKVPVWIQDVFVQSCAEYDNKTIAKIKKLAQEYAPFAFLDKDERYLPTSIGYLLNKDDDTGKGKILDKKLKLNIDLEFPAQRLLLKKPIYKKAHKFAIGTRKKGISLQYNHLDRVLPFNGENISVLDTFKLLGKDARTILENRTGERKYLTIYFSYILNPNPGSKEDQLIINYHFLYTFDPKDGKIGEQKISSHVFDRESINIVFKWNKDSPVEEILPDYIIYGAHLPWQTMGYLANEESELKPDVNSRQQWDNGRVKVLWKDVGKINDRPIVSVAQGSHAPYPIPGWYGVYLKKILPLSTERAGVGKVLVPPGVSPGSTLNSLFKGKNNVFNYKLKDMKIGSITSRSWNSLLAFSGYIVDIGLAKAKFPPFTEREADADQWVNGDDKKDKISKWNTAKVPAKSKKYLKKLITDIEAALGGTKLG